MITNDDIQTVRNLAHKHLGHHRYVCGIYPSDRELNKTLFGSDAPMPEDLSMRSAQRFFIAQGIGGSDAYRNKLRGVGILIAMGKALQRVEQMPTVGEVARRIEENCKIAEAS